MTTKYSPLRVLKSQADGVAKMLKAAERGEEIDARFADKIADARSRETLKFAVMMDDKIITIEMPWAKIQSTSETGLSEYILKQMRESRESVN
ncbi:hypothetical protein AB1K42_15400 [Roseibium algicola]|uniref:hypothetical protein n=1 Tax=Roseibium algicola TaxID=2857014 RepID=UPI003459E947